MTSPRPRPHLAPTGGGDLQNDLAPAPLIFDRGEVVGRPGRHPHQHTHLAPGATSQPNLIGPRSTPAWNSLLDYLNDGHWHPISELTHTMLGASDLAPRTIQNYLARAGRRGWIRRKHGQVKLRDRHALETALAAGAAHA